jgi:hypothetical protein
MLLAMVNPLEAAVINAKSVSLRDVDSAIRSAHEGDTVIVPAGTASWNSTLVLTKGITLQGATVIAGSRSAPTVTDGTVILDDLPRQRKQQAMPGKTDATQSNSTAFVNKAGPMHHWVNQGPRKPPMILQVQLKSTQSFRLTGFTFRRGSITALANDGGIRLQGTSSAVRIDHCHFDQILSNPFVETRGQICGVVDHCVVDASRRCQGFQIYHDGWGNQTHGDGSWADATYFGSEKFLFIEDNTFRKPGPWPGGGIDCFGGGRYVARYNFFNDTALAAHGTETTGRFRGARAIEIYNNVFNCKLRPPRPGQLRSGTLVEFNNLLTGDKGPEHARDLTCYREFWPFRFWGAASGSNRLDLNDPHGLYASGKHTGDNHSDTLVTTNADWRPNQWVGYSITNTTQTLPNGFHPSSCITSNTGDTIGFTRENGFGDPMNFNNGDGFAIYKVLTALDQPGRGKGNLLADKNPAETGSWPGEALEPVYAWGNTYDNSRQLDLVSLYPTIKENRDFYNQKTPFDGSAGVGVGKLADRPKTCTPGVGYWATDQGEWDSTHDGPDGQLYVCTAPDTWSFYYKPYTYPHPLVAGLSAPAKKIAEEKQHQTGNTISASHK